jgi:hypothetical protein
MVSSFGVSGLHPRPARPSPFLKLSPSSIFLSSNAFGAFATLQKLQLFGAPMFRRLTSDRLGVGGSTSAHEV